MEEIVLREENTKDSEAELKYRKKFFDSIKKGKVIYGLNEKLYMAVGKTRKGGWRFVNLRKRTNCQKLLAGRVNECQTKVFYFKDMWGMSFDVQHLM